VRVGWRIAVVREAGAMAEELVILTRYVAIFALAVSIALIFVRWRFPVKEQTPPRSSFSYWKSVWKRWREAQAVVKEREKNLRAVKGVSALVVDPDEKSARMLEWKLEGLGCKVIKARTGAQAVAMTAMSKPGFVVTDALLPDVSAADFYISLQPADVPVVFVGVASNQKEKLRSLGSNVKCLSKPYDPEDAAVLAGRMLRTRNLTSIQS